MKIVGQYSIREIAGETVVVPVGETVLKSNILAVLNETGKLFWELLEKGMSTEEIVSRICSEYNVEPDTVEADLTEFVEYLKDHKVEVI